MEHGRVGLNFFSPVGIASGLGAAGRGYVMALREAEIPHQVVAVHELHTHQATTPFRYRRGRPRFPISVVHVNADATARLWRFHGRSLRRAQYRIGLWVWELATPRKAWFEALQRYDEIWVPSEFCRRAFAAVTTKPVTTIPHVVPTPVGPTDSVAAKMELGFKPDEWLFLYVFDASSSLQRKNPEALWRAFCAEFDPDEPVRLLLKVSNADSYPTFRHELARIAESHPQVVAITERMGMVDLQRLFRACDCYVSPHRSEGFGLTVAEAMALEKPVIATDYGGTADFVNSSTAYPLDYQLTEVRQQEGPYSYGLVWAEPSVMKLRTLMRAVTRDPAQARVQGANARAWIDREFSAAAVGRKIAARLGGIGLT